MRMILLESVEDCEIWSASEERAPNFAVKLKAGRVRVVGSLLEARALVKRKLSLARLARAH